MRISHNHHRYNILYPEKYHILIIMKRFSVYKFILVYGLLLTILTAYVLLDSFLIPHRYEEAADVNTDTVEPVELSYRSDGQLMGEEGSDSDADRQVYEKDALSGDNDDDQMTKTTDIIISEYRINDTDVHVAYLTINDVTDIKTAFADGIYGRNVTDTTSAIAEENDALIAINGDFYGSRQSGYVIRNGVLYREKASYDTEDLVIYKDGSTEIINESEVTAEQLMEKGAWQVFSFGPALVRNGETCVDSNDEVGHAMHSNPRTAIGMIDENRYVFVVSDGRTDDNEGLSLRELAEFMESLGVETAYNLDGGGSSTMVYEGEVINHPTTSGRREQERSVSDIVYISS